MFSHSPVYNLSAVLKATGATADVLRAWERRYGLPMPQRTPGGHRLYSQWDIETVKWLRARQAEGLTISRAVDLWRDAIDAGHNPLSQYLAAGGAAASVSAPHAGAGMDGLRQEWLAASLTYDGPRAEQILTQAFAIYPVEAVLVDLLQRGLREIGVQWYQGTVTEQQEHFATGMASRRLQALIAAAPHATRPQTVAVGCPAGEWHTFPMELLGLLLQRRGLSVLYLGADVPVERLDEAVKAARPDLVILAAQRLSSAATLQSAGRVLRANGTHLAFGGLIFSRAPGLRSRIPAYFLGETLEGSIGAIEQLLLAPAPYPHAVATSKAHQALARLFHEKQVVIELGVVKMLQQAGQDVRPDREALAFFSSALSAALELGDPAFVEPDLEWVEGLLAGRRLRPDALQAYLEAFRRSARKELGQAGLPVTEWISSYLSRAAQAQGHIRRRSE